MTAASTMPLCAGCAAILLTKRQSALTSTFVAGRNCHVSPPSADLNTPMPTSPALASPVPMYTVAGFSGSKAIVLIERLGRKSWFTRQVFAPSSLIHRPPEAAPASSRLAERGSKASERTRPPVFDGPSACHCDGCSPAAFSSPSDRDASSIALRSSCARRICAALGGPFSSASSLRLYSAEIGVPRSRPSSSSSASFANGATSIG